MTEQSIVVISPFYNAEKYIKRCILSVANQKYENYIHVLIDDCSTDNSYEIADSCIKTLPKSINNNFIIIKNTENVGAVCNQINVLRNNYNITTSPHDIIMLLDGDDALVGDPSIFSYYNKLYDNNTEFTYGSCWSLADNIPLIAQPYPPEIKQSKTYRQYKFNWNIPYTHLRTFRRYLIDNVSDDVFKDMNGNWFKAGGDNATFYNIIEQADSDKIKVVSDIVCLYNDLNEINDYKVNTEEQTQTANYIINKKAKFSVVVPTMWRYERFIDFLKELVKNDYVNEIIIINNDSAKTPKDDILNHYKILVKAVNQENIFVNPAWNYGVLLSSNEKICILNDDIEFDLRLFEKIDSFYDKDFGVIGLCPGEPDFNQPPVVNGNIDIIPWSGEHTYGFGCLMFVKKSTWEPIPIELKIYYGDNFIFDRALSQGKTNYIITNLLFRTPFAVTTSDNSITEGILQKETSDYINIKNKFIMNESQQKKTILIAIPTAKYIESDTFKSIYDLIIPEGYTVTYQHFFGYNIAQIRNLISDWVIKGFDYLFSVDSDITFQPDTLLKLLSHDKDVVSGMYIQRIPNTHNLELYCDTGRIDYENIMNKGLIQISGCGFGCVLVKKEVFVGIGYPQFEYHSAIDHNETISEDVDFCKKAIDKGFSIWADTSIKCSHIGNTTFDIKEPVLNETQHRFIDLRNQRLLPTGHVNYLHKMKNDFDIKPKVIYDIGACVLHWTDEAKRVWNDATFIVFEAMKETEFLYKNEGLLYHNEVLGSQDGSVVSFYKNVTHPGGNSYYRENIDFNKEALDYFPDSSKETRVTMTLDSVVEQRGFPYPNLIKMDVQGAELDIIKGATNILKYCNDLILELQVVEYNKNAPLRDEVIDYLNSIGFYLVGTGPFHDAGPDGDYHFTKNYSLYSGIL